MNPKKQRESNKSTTHIMANGDKKCQKSAKQLDMMNEENNNNNNNDNETSNCNQKYANPGYLSVPRTSSRASSSANSSSSEGDELRSSAAAVARDDESLECSSPTGSSSSSGAEDLASSSSSSSQELSGAPTPELRTYQQSNIVPETRRANLLVDSIRMRFLDLLVSNGEDQYEECDLRELRNKLPPPESQEQSVAFRWISRFLRHEQFVIQQSEDEQLDDKELNELVEKLKEFLQFRHQFQVPHIRPDEFCQEFYRLHGIFPFGCDKQLVPVMYLRANVHRRWSQKLDHAFRRYVVWQIDLITKSYKGAMVQKSIGFNRIEKDGSFGICFDCLNVSYSCVDMDFLRFLVRLLVHCYPTYCRYALCVDLPWLFRSVWKLVRSWLPEEARNTVHLITSKQLVNFIDEDQIPNSMRASDERQTNINEKRKHRLPENYESIRNFEEFARELQLGSSEIKSFKAHMEKVLKEYKQLGAI